MFAGHYAASFAAKKADHRIPLWQLFLASQFIDIVWAIFILFGIEKAKISNTGHPASPLDLFYMPFTHSLIGVVFWAAIVYIVVRVRTAKKGMNDRKIPLLLALTVFSHWVLDLVVHVHDLPLFGDQFKVGFGIYRSQTISFILEEILLLGTMYLYAKTTKGQGFAGRYGFWIYALVLTFLNLIGIYGPLPPNIKVVGIYNLTFYLVNAFVIYRLERKRIPVYETIPGTAHSFKN